MFSPRIPLKIQLDAAIHEGNLDRVKALVKEGAPYLALNEEKENSLSLAILFAYKETSPEKRERRRRIVMVMVRDKHQANENIGSCILTAALFNDVELTKLLCEKAGRKIASEGLNKFRLGEGNSALHLSAIHSNEALWELLITYGAKIDVKNKKGETPSDLKASAIERRPRSASSSSDDSSTSSEAEKFIAYLRSAPLEEDFSSLGAVEKHTSQYFFEESESSKQLASELLSAYWADKRNVKRTLASHEDNYAHSIEQTGSEKEIFPSSISFVSLRVNDERICLVSLSWVTFHGEEYEHLKKFINNYSLAKKGVKFILLESDFHAFNLLFKAMGHEHLLLGNSEIQYCYELYKLFKQHGEQVSVEGVANCSFYPYKSNKYYGSHPQSCDTKVRPYLLSSGTLSLNNGIIVGLRPSSAHSSGAKHIVMQLLKAAQQYGELQLQAASQASITEHRPRSP